MLSILGRPPPIPSAFGRKKISSRKNGREAVQRERGRPRRGQDASLGLGGYFTTGGGAMRFKFNPAGYWNVVFVA